MGSRDSRRRRENKHGNNYALVRSCPRALALASTSFPASWMGISDEKLVDARSVPAGLRCVICTDVFAEPLCAVNCQHVFCASCINRALGVQPQCPLCRVALDAGQLRPCQPLRALLDDLQVRCDYKASGCGWTGAAGA